ncbi:MAG: HypC/HybG/HupF family hydrogenase formation chaperone [Geminicoccaceae bacterium]
MCLGVPAQVTRIIDAERFLAMVEVSGVERETNVICVAPETGELGELVGQWVLLHVGFAMSVIDAAEAARTLEVLSELGEVQAELEAMRDSAALASAKP